MTMWAPAALLMMLAVPRIVLAVPVVITYQGRLTDAGAPVEGAFDLQFRLFDAATAGNMLNSETFDNVAVAGGLFTVRLGFDDAVFDGGDRWLEIGVRAGDSEGVFTLLAPRQPLTAQAYAVRALTATNAVGVQCTGCIDNLELSFDPATQSELDAHKASGDHDLRYAPLAHLLFVRPAGNGDGIVSSNPPGIFCGGHCAASYGPGQAVALTATPDATSSFAGWSGACTGGAPSCTVTMDGVKSVAATFTRLQYALTVSRTGGGTVTSDPSGIYCGADCSEVLPAGTMVTLTAVPDPGSTFVGWSGGTCTGNGTCSFTMSSARFVSATFTP